MGSLRVPLSQSCAGYLLLKSITVGCFISRLSENTTGPIYVMSSRPLTELLGTGDSQIGTQVPDASCSTTPPRWKSVLKKEFRTTERKREKKKANTVEILPVHPKMTRRKVDAAQPALGYDVIDDELPIHDPVAQPQEPDREVFALTVVAALSHKEQSSLVVTEDADAKVDGPPGRNYILPDVDLAFSGMSVPYEASRKPMSSKLLLRP